MTYFNGDTYEGEWKNSKKSGIGKYTFREGGVYEGCWDEDEKNG